MEKSMVSVKKSTILFMKECSRMILTMVLVDLFTLMEIIISVSGSKESGKDMESWLISQVKCIKVIGSRVDLWVLDTGITLYLR
jgi:hypothetical protein